jgi:hypothetical protein
MGILRKIFRYRLTAVFFVIGQLLMLFTEFGALGIYNKAYYKEQDRRNALYNSRIQLDVTTTKNMENFSYVTDGIDSTNVILAGKISVGISELGSSYRCEVILTANEPLKFELSQGRLPGTDISDSGFPEIAVGKNKVKAASYIDGYPCLTIEGEVYRIVGVLGSEKSDYWDDKVILSYNTLGENAKKVIQQNRNFVINIVSESEIEDEVLSKVYGNIKSLDNNCVIEATRINADNDSTVNETLHRENLRTNIIAYIFCIINCMIISEFWILQRRKEFAIKKLLGMKNVRLIMEFVENIAALDICALFIFLCVYVCTRLAGAELIVIDISARTVIFTLLSFAVSMLATLIYPTFKILRGRETYRYI